MSRIVETFVNVNRNRVTNIASTGYTISSEDDTVNCLFASGDVALNSNLFNIGKRLAIRKLHATAGTININITNATFTGSALTSLKLRDNSNFWILEKVSPTRWELVEGYESYETGSIYVTKKADSSMLISYMNLGLSYINIARYSVESVAFPEPFVNTDISINTVGNTTAIETLGYTKVGAFGAEILTTETAKVVIYSYDATFTDVGPVTIKADFKGKWF